MAKEVPNVPELRSNSTIWHEKMVSLLGSEKAVSDYMRDIGAKGGVKSNSKKGFGSNKDRAKAAGQKSGRVRRAR